MWDCIIILNVTVSLKNTNNSLKNVEDQKFGIL